MTDPEQKPPLDCPVTTYLSRKDFTILKLLAKNTPYNEKQIMRYAIRRYFHEVLTASPDLIGG